MGSKITVVVAECFGDRVRQRARLGPVWVVRSKENTRAADELRRARRHRPGHVVVFDPQGKTVESVALAALEAINLRYAEWAECEVIGVRPTEALAKALHAFGAGAVESTRAGFVFLRESSAA